LPLTVWQIIALGRDAQRAQSETGRGNARHTAQRSSRRRSPVPNQAGLRTGLVIEKIAGPALHIVQQRVRSLRNLRQRPVDEDAGSLRIILRRLRLGLRLLTRLHRRSLRLVLKTCRQRSCRRADSKHAGRACGTQKLSSSYF